MKKNKNKDYLDTETQYADMNVEGMPWYDAKKKENEAQDKPQKLRRPVSRREYWKIVKATYLSWLPIIGVILAIALVLFLVSYLWLGI